GNISISSEKPSPEEYKSLHRAIKKTKDDIDSLSLNTSVSSFMICVNELTALKCNKREILKDLCLIISPFAPHITEELWQILGHSDSLAYAEYPVYNESYMKEDSFDYPIMVNGKMRLKMKFSLDTPKEQIQEDVLADETIQKWLEGKTPKKVIIVPKKIVNLVI
ncbi:MAG: leucine--tRNA ligase, partial [Bacteroidetes bacterium]